MLDLIDVMQWTGLSTLAVVVYVLAFNAKTNVRRSGPYAIRNWNFHVKKFWALRMLRKKALTDADKAIDFQNFESEQLIGDNQLHTSQFIFGTDNKGNTLQINLTVGKDGFAEIWLSLELANDGGRFALPAHPNVHSVRIGPINEDRFEIAGLTFQCLEAYTKWRISYAGLLRKVDGQELHFVKFNFFWTMNGQPQHWPADWSNELKASALATEPWRHGHWSEYLSTNGYGGFDQFGSLFGQVHLHGTVLPTGEATTIELNLPGVRQRRWTSYEQEKVSRSCTILGVSADGAVFVLGAHRLERNLSNAQFGHIRTANGRVNAIDWTDFHLAEFAENPAHIPAAVTITFRANGRSFSTTVYTKHNPSAAPRSGNVPHAWTESVVPAEIGLNGEHGTGLVRLWYANNSTRKQTAATTTTPTIVVGGVPSQRRSTTTAPLLLGSLQRPTRTKIAYWFTDAGAQSEAIAGGKGASLAMLTAALEAQRASSATGAEEAYRVPAGFVLSVSAYDLQLSMHPEIGEAIQRVQNIAYGRLDAEEDSADLAAACQHAVHLIETVHLEPEVEQTLAKYYRTLHTRQQGTRAGAVPPMRLAVRSSAIGEDGEDASSAGQNETLLGVRTLDEVLVAVRRCWASLYALRSVEYRRQRLLPVDTQMAVVVQLMVPAEVAGVMFTRDPRSGDPRTVLVTANWGLGESVVSGDVEPDTFVVAKRVTDAAAVAAVEGLRIVETKLGSKTHSIRMTEEGREGDDGEMQTTAVVRTELSKAEQQRASLTEAEVLRLAQIGVRLEALYGNARDIEWALFGNEFHILQSRPITTANAMSNWELLHEFDTSVMSTDDHFSFANVGEVMPECITPLSQSTVMVILQRASLANIDPDQRYNARFCSSFAFSHYRLMFDIYHIMLTKRSADISLADRILSICVAGRDFITAHMHRVSVWRHGVMKTGQTIDAILDITASMWRNKAVVERTQRFMQTFGGRFADANLRLHFADQTAQQFAAEIDFELDDEDRADLVFKNHAHSSKVSTFAQLLALSMLAEGATTLTADHYADIALMLGSCTDVESAEVPAMLDEIVTTVYMAGLSAQFVAVPPAEGEAWLAANCAAAARQLRNFLSRHGHRALKEFELESVTWGMRPEIVVRLLQTNCRHANDILCGDKATGAGGKRAQPLTNPQIVAALRTPQKSSTRSCIGYLLTLCKRSVQRRETTKSCLIAYVHELRRAYRHLAAMLVHDGLLPDAELIWFLRRSELARLMRRPATIGFVANRSALLAKAQRRRRLMPSWSKLRFAELNAYLTRPINGEDADGAAVRSGEDGDDAMVHGTSVSEGVVTARACVIDSFADVDQIRAGDVLVTNSTDIAWSTYFPILGGVVTELGGLISHGAVVAREYGLPCIVGATGATQRLRNGERVTLNATKGWIARAVAGEETEESEA